MLQQLLVFWSSLIGRRRFLRGKMPWSFCRLLQWRPGRLKAMLLRLRHAFIGRWLLGGGFGRVLSLLLRGLCGLILNSVTF